MDRAELRLDERSPGEILDVSLRQSADLCARWHGRDGGRLHYAFTPRFAVSCSADMLRESAALAASTGAYWQTHLSEDARRARRGRPPVPRGRSTTSTSTTGPAGSGRGRSLPTRSTSRTGRSPGSPRPAPRVAHCPGVEPVPRLRARCPSPGTRRWDPGRPGLRRGGRPRAVDLRRHAGGGVHAERPPRARGRRRGPSRWPRSTGCGSRRWTAPGRSAWRTRSVRSRRARRPT